MKLNFTKKLNLAIVRILASRFKQFHLFPRMSEVANRLETLGIFDLILMENINSDRIEALRKAVNLVLD